MKTAPFTYHDPRSVGDLVGLDPAGKAKRVALIGVSHAPVRLAAAEHVEHIYAPAHAKRELPQPDEADSPSPETPR